MKLYDGPGHGDDDARDIVVDDSGNIYVTGDSYDSLTDADYATIKYYPNGDTAWLRRYNGSGNGFDLAYAMAIDGSNNVYVTGESFDSVTHWNYTTIKYYPNGDTAWVRTYNGPGNFDDYARATAIDASNNIYVTGCSYGMGTSYDYATIKYDSSGNEVWVQRYNGAENGYDYAHAIALDDSGGVCVTGVSYGGWTNYDVATVKYDSSGNEVWFHRYDGPDNDYDCAYAIAVDVSGNVYVTGVSYGSETVSEYVTIKYVETALRGDASGDGVIDIGDVVYLINYLFIDGPAPEPLEAGNANCDQIVDSGDIIYLINYLFIDGPPPDC